MSARPAVEPCFLNCFSSPFFLLTFITRFIITLLPPHLHHALQLPPCRLVPRGDLRIKRWHRPFRAQLLVPSAFPHCIFVTIGAGTIRLMLSLFRAKTVMATTLPLRSEWQVFWSIV